MPMIDDEIKGVYGAAVRVGTPHRPSNSYSGNHDPTRSQLDGKQRHARFHDEYDMAVFHPIGGSILASLKDFMFS